MEDQIAFIWQRFIDVRLLGACIHNLYLLPSQGPYIYRNIPTISKDLEFVLFLSSSQPEFSGYMKYVRNSAINNLCIRFRVPVGFEHLNLNKLYVHELKSTRSHPQLLQLLQNLPNRTIQLARYRALLGPR